MKACSRAPNKDSAQGIARFPEAIQTLAFAAFPRATGLSSKRIRMISSAAPDGFQAE